MSEAAETSLLEKFEIFHGPVDSPRQVAFYNDFVARCTGRTTVMIQAIAKCLETHERVGVLVHKTDAGKEICNRLRHEYGVDLKRVYILSAHRDYWKEQLRGRTDFPIFVDNAVTDMRSTDFVKYVNDFNRYGQ